MPLDLVDGGQNKLYVFFATEQNWLREPDGLPCCPGGIGKVSLQEWIFLILLFTRETFAVLSTLENSQLMEWRITRLGRDTLSIQSLCKACDG